ncbi:hypothetical protein MTO96_046114, partial [Rhipicephalus appendiculatus]
FGSYHDGDGTSIDCPAADGYLMSPASNGKHSEEFSACSRRVISKYIRSQNAACLLYAASTTVIGVFPRPLQPSLRGNPPGHKVEKASRN